MDGNLLSRKYGGKEITWAGTVKEIKIHKKYAQESKWR